MSEEFRSTLERRIKTDGSVVIKAEGSSMKPFIRPLRDILVIEKIEHPVKRNDIILFYYRGKIILHRVVAVHNGLIDARGDHNYMMEKDIDLADVFGRLKVVKRNEHEININSLFYVILAELWNSTRWLRRIKGKIFRG